MEKYSMLLDWNKQYCKNGHNTQTYLQKPCNPYQMTHDIFHRTRTNNAKIHMEPQRTQNCQSNPEEQKTSRRHHSPRLQAIFQSHSPQASVVLVPKQIYRPMEQNREPRNKPWHLWLINLWQRRQDIKCEIERYPEKQSADLMQSLSKYQWHFSQN